MTVYNNIDLYTILSLHANADTAAILQRFFKTGPGQYGEGDKFLGIRVPTLHELSKGYRDQVDLKVLQKSLRSPWHEERMLALLIAVLQYKQTKDPKQKQRIYNFYVRNFRHINNWDLVDLTAPKLSGDYIFNYGTPDILFIWAQSEHLWTRRIAVLSSFYFLRQNDFAPTLQLCETLLGDKHDLMHKACGWMLREIGKRDETVLRQFLDNYATQMPRTMLRYSIERLNPETRMYYMKR